MVGETPRIMNIFQMEFNQCILEGQRTPIIKSINETSTFFTIHLVKKLTPIKGVGFSILGSKASGEVKKKLYLELAPLSQSLTFNLFCMLGTVQYLI